MNLEAQAPAAYLGADEVIDPGERDYAEILVSPHPAVVQALRDATDVLELCRGGLPSQL